MFCLTLCVCSCAFVCVYVCVGVCMCRRETETENINLPFYLILYDSFWGHRGNFYLSFSKLCMFLIFYYTHVSHFFIENKLLKALGRKIPHSFSFFISLCHLLVFCYCYNKWSEFSGLRKQIYYYTVLWVRILKCVSLG